MRALGGYDVQPQLAAPTPFRRIGPVYRPTHLTRPQHRIDNILRRNIDHDTEKRRVVEHTSISVRHLGNGSKYRPCERCSARGTLGSGTNLGWRLGQARSHLELQCRDTVVGLLDTSCRVIRGTATLSECVRGRTPLTASCCAPLCKEFVRIRPEMWLSPPALARVEQVRSASAAASALHADPASVSKSLERAGSRAGGVDGRLAISSIRACGELRRFVRTRLCP